MLTGFSIASAIAALLRSSSVVYLRFIRRRTKRDLNLLTVALTMRAFIVAKADGSPSVHTAETIHDYPLVSRTHRHATRRAIHSNYEIRHARYLKPVQAKHARIWEMPPATLKAIAGEPKTFAKRLKRNLLLENAGQWYSYLPILSK